MDTDLENLVQKFYDYFLKLYDQKGGAQPGKAFLAFEPLGTMIEPSAFKLKTGEYSDPLEVEVFSGLANPLPYLSGTTIQTSSLWGADDLYEMMVMGAQPLATTNLDFFAKLKADADRDFSQAETHPFVGTQTFRPAYPTPKRWWDASGASLWTSRKFTVTETTTTEEQTGTPPPLPTPRPKPVIDKWTWRMLPEKMTPVLSKPALLKETVAMHTDSDAVIARPRFSAAKAATMSPGLQATLSDRQFQRSAIAMKQRPVADFTVEDRPVTKVKLKPVRQLDSDVLAARKLAESSSSKQVTSKSLSLSFDYCLVGADRPWLSAAFINTGGWYLPNCTAGQYASGTGIADAECEVITMAALVIKNLRIVADWSNDDMANLNSAGAFGPFSLVGRTFDQVTNTLGCEGMQIVAWVCLPLPCLPPASDPALAPANPPAADPTAGDTTTPAPVPQ